MMSKTLLIDKINNIPECPTHVAQVGRDLQAATDDNDAEDIVVAALLDAYRRSYELQAKLYDAIDGPKGYSMKAVDVQTLNPQLIEALRTLLG